jgi:hypothetical protein
VVASPRDGNQEKLETRSVYLRELRCSPIEGFAMKHYDQRADHNIGADDETSFTIQQFCALENFSIAYFYKLKQLGNAPRVVNPPGTNLHRITADERRAWHERMYEAGKQDAAKREAERRSEITRRAGKIAAALSTHHSKRGRAKASA